MRRRTLARRTWIALLLVLVFGLVLIRRYVQGPQDSTVATPAQSIAEVGRLAGLEVAYHQRFGTYVVGPQPRKPDGFEPLRGKLGGQFVWDSISADDQHYCVDVQGYRFKSGVDSAPTKGSCS